ncbi:MAG TPA: P-II family nitrogen regulator [Methylomirabilota bacterium]|jgi:nitrogen regulatory protein PII
MTLESGRDRDQAMKTLEALILTFNLDRVKQGLQALGLNEMTLVEAPSVWRSGAVRPEVSATDFLPRIRVRVAVPDHMADQVEEIFRDAV